MTNGTTTRGGRGAVRVAIATLTTAVVLALALSLASASATTEPIVDATITILTAPDCASQSTGPFKIAISDDGANLYVTLNGDGRVAKLSTATDTVVATSCTGARYPEDVAVSPDGTRVYVTNSAASVLRVLNAADMSLVTDVNVGNSGNGVDVVTTPVSVGKVYVYRHLEGSLVVVNAADNTIATTVSVGASTTRRASGLAASTDGSTVYALVDAGIAVVATATNTVTSTIPLTDATAVAVSPDGSFLYVVGGPGDSSLMRVRTSDGAVVATVAIGSGPRFVAITPDGLHALVTLNPSNSVVFVDTATDAVTSTVTVGSSPYGAGITPSGAFAYVANWGGGYGNTLSRIALDWGPPPTSEPPTSEPPTSATPTSGSPATTSSVDGALPATGVRTDVLVVTAVLIAGLGAVLSVISRRRA